MHLRKVEKQEAIQFVDGLILLYFSKRDVTALPSYMEEYTSWIGTGETEISRNLSQVKQALYGSLSEYGGDFTVTNSSWEFVPISESACVVYGTLSAVPSDRMLSDENMRLSVVLERTENGLKLLHMHCSHADLVLQKGHYFVRQTTRADNRSLRIALNDRERQLANLTKNVPGGAYQCADDAGFTLLSIGDGFLSMFGYTEEEINQQFEGKYMNMVYPGDREKLIRNMDEQLKKGSDLELEYRVQRKNGSPVWVLDKSRRIDNGDGAFSYYCLLIDITERKRQQEELRLSLERHQVIMDQATDIIFEWDIQQDTLNFSSNWRKKFGYSPIDTSISERIPISEDIHPDDMVSFMKIMSDTREGVPYSETEFRIRNSTGRYFWCRIRATTQYNSEGRPIKAVGVIVDIDAEKKQKQALLDQAQRDALTGLYNKAAIRALVEQRTQCKDLPGCQAMLIIDVDNFKTVNDTYGHLSGDSVLSDVGVALRGGTRSTDLVGRIGGDEFLVYLPEVTDEAAVRQKAEHLLNALEMIIPASGAAPISCSVGAAVFPCGSIDYYALYKCADQALYRQKNNRRGGVAFFEPNVAKGEVPCGLSPTAVGGDIGSDENVVMDEGLAQYTFRTLYRATDIESTIDRLLEIIGRSYDVSRAYIFESSADGQYCSNTFEWCNDGVTRQMDRLQHIAYVDQLADYEKNFDVNGTFYCGEIESLHPNLYAVLEPQGIHSMLQCAILDEGKFLGYVGFDECRENRTWNAQQVASFKLTADVLATFLVKLRQKQKLEAIGE